MHYAYDRWINCVVINSPSYWLDVACDTERQDNSWSEIGKNMYRTKLQAKLLLLLLLPLPIERSKYYYYYYYY